MLFFPVQLTIAVCNYPLSMLLVLLLLIIKYFIARLVFEKRAQELKLKSRLLSCGSDEEEMAGRRGCRKSWRKRPLCGLDCIRLHATGP